MSGSLLALLDSCRAFAIAGGSLSVLVAIVAEGRVYFQNRDGLTTVVSASRRFRRLAENQLNDVTIASPAVSDQSVFFRGRKWLYRIQGTRGD